MNIIDLYKARRKENKFTPITNICTTVTNDEDWKPTECTKYEPREFIVPCSRKVKTDRERLSKALAFIYLIKPKRLKDKVTVMPISTTGKRLISICGNPMGVSRFLGFLKEIQLIDLYDEHYQYNATNESYNKCKLYRYHYNVEQQIEKYCDMNGINRFIVPVSYKVPVPPSKQITSFDNSKVRFSSKVHFLCPDNFTRSEFEDYLTYQLYQNYPDYAYYQQQVEDINQTYYSNKPDFQLHFDTNYTWRNGKKRVVRKIGIRATNQNCNSKKEKDGNPDYSGKYREDLIRDNNLDLSYDIKSSIAKLTMSINMGTWLGDIDVYELIFNRYEELKGGSISDYTKLARAAAKAYHQCAYFDSPSCLGRNVYNKLETNIFSRDEVKTEMQLFKQAVLDIEGTGYDSEIFYFESCLSIDITKTLLEQGYKCLNIYDGWYCHKDGVTQAQFEKYMDELIADKANELISRVQNYQNVA